MEKDIFCGASLFCNSGSFNEYRKYLKYFSFFAKATHAYCLRDECILLLSLFPIVS